MRGETGITAFIGLRNGYWSLGSSEKRRHCSFNIIWTGGQFTAYIDSIYDMHNNMNTP